MKNIYVRLLEELERGQHPALCTILEAVGSAPQKAGASALFSETALLFGTLGGGLVEARSRDAALECLRKKRSAILKFSLDDEAFETEGLVCGGSVTILIDAAPLGTARPLRDLRKSLSLRRSGLLATRIERPLGDAPEVTRHWVDEESRPGGARGEHDSLFEAEIREVADISKGAGPRLVKKIMPIAGQEVWGFLEPVSPLPRLIIAGAGHIGQALSTIANGLDFEVTVIDDRPEYASRTRFPDADALIVSDIGRAVRDLDLGPDAYVVIVTRGHARDAEALRASLGRNAAYIGMIGSVRKVGLMRENFVRNGWATEEEFDRVRAPVGLPIGSKTLGEIAVSIAAELVLVRSGRKPGGVT